MTDFLDVGLREEEPRESRRNRRDEVARKKRRQNRWIRTTIAVVVSLALIAVAVNMVLPVVKDFFASEPPPEDYAGPGTGEVMIEVPSGASGGAIGDVLVDADVVASREAFVAAYNADPNATSIQAGFYNLQLQMPAADAVRALQDRANRAETRITIPEGFRAHQVVERIANVMEIPLEEVQAAAADPAAYGLPEEAGGNPEGWLGAQTYILPPNADAPTILRLMVEETVGTLEGYNVPREEWQATLTKASIVQAEGIPGIFGEVARVIENRLSPDNRETMGRLEMDSTILYGVGQLGGVPTQAQKDEDTPYNTYIHAGLPPTPIGSPGREVIEATVNPPEGDWLYFVTVNLHTGETKFAATFDEHLVNVQEFREWQAANPDSQEEPAGVDLDEPEQ